MSAPTLMRTLLISTFVLSSLAVPHQAQIDTKIDTDVLELKQWYNYQTEDEPYRHYHITCEYIDDVTVITHPVNQETGKPSCNLQWGYFNGWWFGEVQGECILRNTRVESEIQFNGYFYRSRDTGYDVETGEFRWGKGV